MKLIIHDLEVHEVETFAEKEGFTGEVKFIGPDSKIKACTGCFGCWVKTPGTCIIKDEIRDIGKWIAKSDEIIIISACVYGSYSPFIRNVLDRSISYLLPYLTISHGEMHHMRRYKKHSARLQVLFYGEEITAAEKEIAEDLVAANARNFYSHGNQVAFYDQISELEAV